MKIAAISDTHGYLPTPPECDVLIHAGDWTPATNHSREFQKNWASHNLETFLISNLYGPVKKIVSIAGNHDFVARSDEKLIRELAWHYLKNESVEIDGVKFWGSPYSTKFGNWAFMRDEDGLNEIWQTIPEDTNVLITHGPPYGFGDKVAFPREDEDPHQGSKTLRARMSELSELKLVLFGHIHEGAGVYGDKSLAMNMGFVLANCSYVNLQYKPRHGYLEFEI